jgi:hypothetical protein
VSPVVSPTKSKHKRIEEEGGGGGGGSSVVPRLALGDLGCGGGGGVLKEREKRSGREGSAAMSRAGARAPRDVKGGGGANDIAAGPMCGVRGGEGGINDKIHFFFSRSKHKMYILFHIFFSVYPFSYFFKCDRTSILSSFK